MKSLYSKFLIVGIFAIAMGFLEAVVVVYLREIYYPDGFFFPLTIIEPAILGIELVREISTLVMLICIGLLAGKSGNEKFAWFLYTFGMWDIFYYIGLKVFLDWPESFLTWDILFLIPVSWIGPVLAPVICSLTMIVLAVFITKFSYRKLKIQFGRMSWFLLILGAFLIFLSFIQDYTLLLIQEGFFNTGGPLFSEISFNDAIVGFMPDRFNWWLFGFGELLILAGIFKIGRDHL